MQTKTAQTLFERVKTLFLYTLGFSGLLAFFILNGCGSHPDSASSPKDTPQIADVPPKSNETPLDSNETARFTSVESIVLKEIQSNWTGGGEAAERKIFERLLPEARKQYDLSYAAQTTKASEDLSESNVETTINETEKGRTVTKRKLFSNGEKQLTGALANIKTAAARAGKSLDNLSVEKAQTGNNEEIVRRILITIHKNAVKDAAEIYKPLFDEKTAKL